MKLAGRTWIPDGDQYFGRYFEGGDVFEFGNLLTGLRYVTDFRCAVDGGAHVGSWSRYLASKFDLVLAFEPQPDNYACLLRNIEGSDNVQPLRFALSNKIARVALNPGNNTGCWHVAPGDEVDTTTLDTYGLSALGYLKLDVEGFEWFALSGALDTIEKCRPVIQIEEKALPHSYGPHKARDLLEGMGYQEADRASRDVVFVWG